MSNNGVLLLYIMILLSIITQPILINKSSILLETTTTGLVSFIFWENNLNGKFKRKTSGLITVYKSEKATIIITEN